MFFNNQDRIDVKVINIINSLIQESKILLSKYELSENEIFEFKSKSNAVFISLIKNTTDDIIKKIAQSGLDFKVTKENNLIIRWILDFLKSKGAYSLNAPFLVGHTETDYQKRYVFAIKNKLEGILYNLKNS